MTTHDYTPPARPAESHRRDNKQPAAVGVRARRSSNEWSIEVRRKTLIFEWRHAPV
jgi:hypothetical protein